MDTQRAKVFEQAQASPHIPDTVKSQIAAIGRTLEDVPDRDLDHIQLEVSTDTPETGNRVEATRTGLSLRQKLYVVGISVGSSVVVELLGHILAK